MSKHQLLYLAIAVVVVVAVIMLIASAVRKRRSNQLRSQFGPEYDRTLQTAGSRRNAEAELAGRAERRKSFEVRPLEPGSRQRYEQQWQGVQAGFVDAPAQSVRQADALVTQLMTERGYPMAEFEQRSADVSVDHPREVEDYRRAHAISRANDDNKATTEDLRQAMTHYRSLFGGLLHDGEQSSSAGAGGTASGTGERPREAQGQRDSADLPAGVGGSSGQREPGVATEQRESGRSQGQDGALDQPRGGVQSEDTRA
ncbi:MAG: hypothetical protein ABR541_08130 [Candidatus Dormibacteria bacterium]